MSESGNLRCAGRWRLGPRQDHGHWLTAPERITTFKGLVTVGMLRQRRDAWDVAARHTSHGQPIELG
jgi:hypothetical protein